MKWCAQTFPPIFGLFAIFDDNFAKIVAPSKSNNENANCLVHPKGQFLLKKKIENSIKIDPKIMT